MMYLKSCTLLHYASIFTKKKSTARSRAKLLINSKGIKMVEIIAMSNCKGMLHIK